MSQSLLTLNQHLDFSNGNSAFIESQPLTEKQRLGLTGEKWIKLLLNAVFKYGYKINSNDYDNYAKSQEKGSDFQIAQLKEVLFAIEAKNWLLQKRTYGVETVKEQILTRFEGLDETVIKILFISYKRLFSKEALKLLSDNHIYVYEVEKVFTVKKDNPRANPKFFYQQVEEFKQFIDRLDGKVGMIQQVFAPIVEEMEQKEMDKISKNFGGGFVFSNQSESDCNQINSGYQCKSITDILNEANTSKLLNQSTNQSINQDTNQITNQSDNQSINELVNESINQSTLNQSDLKEKYDMGTDLISDYWLFTSKFPSNRLIFTPVKVVLRKMNG